MDVVASYIEPPPPRHRRHCRGKIKNQNLLALVHLEPFGTARGCNGLSAVAKEAILGFKEGVFATEPNALAL